MNRQALVVRPITQPTEIVSQLRSGQLLQVRGHRGSAIIVCHRHYAELLGPGAAVGGAFDIDCNRVIPLGKVAITHPESRAQRKQAYIMRHKWISFTQKAMQTHVPLQRSYTLLFLLYNHFDPHLIDPLSDTVLARLVGVMPTTMSKMRGYLKAKGLNLAKPVQSVYQDQLLVANQ